MQFIVSASLCDRFLFMLVLLVVLTGFVGFSKFVADVTHKGEIITNPSPKLPRVKLVIKHCRKKIET